jgi:uncharacterized protein (TIGR02996 family)
MTTEEALLAAVWANPHDDLPRLVYADWLDETGDPAKAARAEFIRVQCELARVGWWDDRTGELQRREQQLLTEYRSGWIPRQRLRHSGIAFHRGFYCPDFGGELRSFRTELPVARAVAPLYGVSLARPDGFDAFLNWPPAEGMQTLRLDRQFDWWGKQIAHSPLTRNLARLTVNHPHATAAFGYLCRANHLTHLSELSLPELETTGDIITLLLAAPFTRQLRVLALGADRGFKSAGFGKLLASDSFIRLECLRLHVEDSRYLWGGFIRTLIKKQYGCGLRCLHISGGAITDDECMALLHWPGVSTVRELALTPANQSLGSPLSHLRVETLITLLESNVLTKLGKLSARPINYYRGVTEDPGGRVAKLRQLAHDRGVELDLW